MILETENKESKKPRNENDLGNIKRVKNDSRKKAAPAAEKVLSAKFKLESEMGLGWWFCCSAYEAFPSKSTLVAAPLIHQGMLCLEPTMFIPVLALICFSTYTTSYFSVFFSISKLL